MSSEQTAVAHIRRLAKQIARHGKDLWHIGDGCGGYVRELIEQAFDDAGLEREPRADRRDGKVRIPPGLRKQVFERDRYRCVYCGTHIDLCVDHVIPQSRGGATAGENLVTCCKSCNSKKKAKTPQEWRR